MTKGILFLLATFTILISCRKLVMEDFPSVESKVVLNSIIVAGKPVEVHLSFTQNINRDSIMLIENSLVILSEDGTNIDTLHYIEDGVYKSDILAKQGKTYFCEAQLSNEIIVSSSSYLPKQRKIINFKHIEEAGRDEEGIIHPAVEVTFENNVDETLFFQLFIYLVTEDCDYYFDDDGKVQSQCSELFKNANLLNITDPLIVNEGLPMPIFSNELIEGDSYTMKLDYTTGGTHSSNGQSYTTYYPVVIELRSISYEYYQYVKQLYLYNQGRYPEVIGDVSHVYPLYSNINNGHGIFGGYATYITDTIFVK